MKLRSLLLLSALAIPLTACTNPANTSQPPAALAPGYLNQTDQQMGELLAAAHSFYVSIQQSIATGKYAPSATEKSALNVFAVTLNTAQAAYLAYHASPNAVTEQTASDAVQKVQAQQQALQPSIPGVSELTLPVDPSKPYTCKAGWTKVEGGCTQQYSDGCNTITASDNGFTTSYTSTLMACRETQTALVQGGR